MSPLDTIVRTRIVARAAPLLVRARRGILVGGLTVLGFGAVVLGVAVWGSRYVPWWAMALGCGIAILGGAYLLERRSRKGSLERTAGERLSDRRGAEVVSAEIPCANSHRDALAAHVASMNGCKITASQRFAVEERGIAPPRRAVFALGALIGAGLIQWWSDHFEGVTAERGSKPGERRRPPPPPG